MNIRFAVLLLLTAGAVDDTTFSYEGHLDDRGQPANGVYDVQLTAFPAEKAGASRWRRPCCSSACRCATAASAWSSTWRRCK